ncbi:S8 family serine peptidase [Bacteroidota bacterium]
MRKLSLFLFVTLFSLFPAAAQESGNDYSLYFRTGEVVPEANSEGYISSFNLDNETLFQNQFFKIIQFYHIPDQSTRQALNNAGVSLLDYLPKNAYFAAFQKDFNPATLVGMGIRSISEVAVDYKLSQSLYEGNYPDHAIMGNGDISVVINYYSNLDPDQVVGALQEKGLPVITHNTFGKYINISVSEQEIRNIAELPFIVYMGPVDPEPDPENYTGRTLNRTNAIATDYGAGRHYDGTGVHVELQDDGVIGPHIDYQGRILDQFLSSNSGNHGDHCAGILMGAGNVDSRAKGNAFGAGIYVYSATGYPGFNAIPQDYGNLGIRITSTSYGNGCNAGYNSLARTLDQQVRTFPSIMHVFSTGNSGTSNCGYGAGSGWGNITGGHKVGKNVISVANVNYLDILASSSSRGPAHDGRIKPDLAAKGTSVLSTVNPNTYALKSGTSMACPSVAGTLAQLYQAYRETYNGDDPMAGMIKATLLNTAEDLGNPGPDFKFGWGRVNALRAVKVIEEARFDSGSVDQGDDVTHLIDVPANVAQLRVMVYWTDYEATVNTTWALVNDLNMTLTDPSFTSWNPWVLSHYPHPDSLSMVATRRIDDHNNMEQVTLDDPAAGTYTLNVDGFSVPQGPQTYYVLWEFIPEEVILTYPIGGESFVPGETETIRWDAFGNNETFTLEYSSDNGQTWETINDYLAGSERNFNWTVPNTITGEAIVKITKGGSVSQSDAPFSIIGVPCNLEIDWACSNSVHLSWSPVVGATSYIVLKLGEKYMDSVGTTTITSYIVDDTIATSGSWFSVRAVGEDGAMGRRATSIEGPSSPVNCYQADAMMASFPTAGWGVFNNQMDLTSVSVTVEVRNSGSEPIVDPSLRFHLTNSSVVTEIYSGIIEPDSTLVYTFSDPIDLSDAGSYNLKAWVEYAPDQNPANDELDIPIEVIEGMVITAGYEQNFDGWQKCASAPICELYTCDLEEGWFNLENDELDQHDWRTYSGPTPNIGTGPSTDHTTGTTTGQYLYIEPSNYCLNKEAIINTPCIDLTTGGAAKMTLWYHAWGADIGLFHVDLFDGSDIINDIIPPVYGNHGDEWIELDIDLTPYSGQLVALRFRGVTSCDQAGDFAIDDIAIPNITAIGNEHEGMANRFRVYPNPASGEVTLSLKEAEENTYIMSVVDLFGRIVYRQTMNPIEGRILETINLSGITTGLYLVRMSSEESTYQTKLTVR